MKKLYVSFAKRWDFRHCQCRSELEYEAISDLGKTIKQQKDNSPPHQDGYDELFDELIKSEFFASTKINTIAHLAKVSDTTLNNVIDTFTDSKNYKISPDGDYWLSIEVEDKDYDKLQKIIDKLEKIEKDQIILDPNKPIAKIVDEAEKKLSNDLNKSK